MLSFAEILAQYYKPEEEARLEELQRELNKLDDKTRKEHKEEFEDFFIAYKKGQTILVESWKKDYFNTRDQIHSEAKAINEAVLNRYKEEKKPEGILEDVRRIADSYEKEYFQAHIKHVQSLLEAERFNIHIKGENEGKPYTAWLAENAEENYRNCFAWLYGDNTEVEELLDGEDLYAAIEIFKARIDAFGYERPTEGVLSSREGELEPPRVPSFFPVLHGRATDAIARMSSKSSLFQKDQIANTATLSTGKGEKEVRGVITEFDKLAGALGVSTHKLLMTGIGVFTGNNHTGEKSREVRATEVVIPLKEYAKMCDYDVDIKPTRTPAEAKKEAERAKNALKNARKKINKDLEVLYNFSLSWKEKVKGKDTDYRDYRLIDHKAIENGYIKFNFAKHFSEYLILLPLNQYPEALLSLDERNSNAYNIGVQLSYHFNNDNNIGKGTAQLLKVKTILSYTNLPSIEAVRGIEASWINRIKEPLEKALDALGGCGYLEDWEYTHAKGEALTDKEAKALLNDYEVWTETLIKFTLSNSPDHAPRLEAKAQRIAEAEAKKAKRSSNTKKKKSQN